LTRTGPPSPGETRDGGVFTHGPEATLGEGAQPDPAHNAAQDIADWLRLTEIRGIGAAAVRHLLGAFGLPAHIFSASAAALEQVVAPTLARSLLAPPDAALQALIERTVAWAAQAGNTFLTLADRRYPPQLLNIADPPALLYVKGRLELLAAVQLGMVGSRDATAQGIANALHFASTLSRAGLTICSGLAQGIDAAAHDGALQGAGSTVAVIGTGADVVYPARNRSLAHRIAEAGALVSEFPLGTAPLAHHFPRRNRIIAGLSRGILVVEAAAQSGSLITARLAGEQGRDVYAIPGSIHAPLSRGSHRLIRQGAILVETPEDILEEMQFCQPHRTGAQENLPLECDALLQAIGHDPTGFDALVQRSGLQARQLAGRLLELELAELIIRLPGDHYQRLSLVSGAKATGQTSGESRI